MNLRIYPKSLRHMLTLIVLALTVVNIGIQFCAYILGYNQVLAYAHPFAFGGNANVPKWFASSNLLLSVLLLVSIALAEMRRGSPYSRHWSALALIFCAISLNEAVGFHELTTQPLGSALYAFGLHASGLLFHTWIILGVILTPIIALMYWRFLFHLPVRTRRLFLFAAILYVGGALGMEIIRGPYNEAYGTQNMIAALLKTSEEFCQMSGIVVFIYALLVYLGVSVKEMHVYIGDEASKVSNSYPP